MPYAPTVNYHGDQYIAQGFESVAKAIADAQRANQQQQQFDAQLAEQQRAHNFSYGEHADTLAKDYYDIEQRNAPYTPPTDAIAAATKAGYAYLPQSKHGGSYVPMHVAGDTPALGADPTGTGNFYFNGKTLSQVRPEGAARIPAAAVPLITSELTQMQNAQAQMQAKDAALAEARARVAAGHTGFLGFFNPQNDVDKLTRERADLAAQFAASEANIAKVKSTMGGGVPSQPQPRRPVQAPAPAEVPGSGGFGFGASSYPAPAPGAMPATVEPPLPTGGGPVRVSSKAERDALPAGTRYVGPDGKVWVKQ